MNLAEMLSYADIRQLNRIAMHYECECSVHSKNSLIQSILAAVNRKDVFEQTVRSLTWDDVRFLNAILFDRRDAFSLEELLAWARQGNRSDGSPRDTIVKFTQIGWLFNGHSHQTKTLFAIPRDIKQKIGDMLARQWRADMVVTDDPPVYRDEHDFLPGDCLRFLEFVRLHEPQLTADGYMYKRHLQQLLSLLQVEEAPVAKGGWRFGYGRRFKEYPNRFSLIYDYCYYEQLIEEGGDRLALTERGEQAVMEGRVPSPADLYRFWIRLYKGPVRNIQAVVHWICRLCPQWTTVDSLKNTLTPLVSAYYYDQPEDILEQRLLKMMMHLGLLQIGEHEDGTAVVRMKPVGVRIVQGTYVEEADRIELPENRGNARNPVPDRR